MMRNKDFFDTCLDVILILLIGLYILLAFTGCSTISYETPDGSKLHYSRFGSQQIDGLIFESGDTQVLLEGQKSDAEDLARGITKGVIEGMK